MKKIICLVLVLLFGFVFVSCKDKEKEDLEKIEKIVNNMKTEDKIAQMIMLACRSRDGVDFEFMTDEVKSLLQKYPFGGMILYAQNTKMNQYTFELNKAIQDANKKDGRPGLFIAIDQEGGRVTRLGQGCDTPGNMALGAINSFEDTKTIAKLIASEVKTLGFNVDFAPVTDINNNPNNPVIGTRSFSDDKDIVSNMVGSFIDGLFEEGVIGSLKHFPGHGDTATDSHTGLPLIMKTKEELKALELVPYINNIDKIEMVMTAHILYPEIEKTKYISKLTGEEITLPATLSKTILTDLLRGELGYRGLVVTDALEMDAISKHFEKLDVAKYAINAGADILLMPVDISTENGINELIEYINDVKTLVDKGDIDINIINEAVKRILKLKEKHNLLNGYVEGNIDDIKNVGSVNHHDIEWDITKKAITLLKNQNALPLLKNERVLFVTKNNDKGSVYLGLSKAEVTCSVMSTSEIGTDYLLLDQGYEKIVFVTQMNNTSYLSSSEAEKIKTMINFVHSIGKKAIVLSTNLPYDVAKFNNADAIVVCYSPKTAYEIPNEIMEQIRQYGPNIPAAIYMMYNDSNYTGKLPINIYKINSDNKITDEILYNRWYGLNK